MLFFVHLYIYIYIYWIHGQVNTLKLLLLKKKTKSLQLFKQIITAIKYNIL